MPPRQVIKLTELAGFEAVEKKIKAQASLPIDLEPSPLHDAIRAYLSELN